MKTKRRKPSKRAKIFNFGRIVQDKPIDKQEWHRLPGLKMVNGVWV